MIPFVILAVLTAGLFAVRALSDRSRPRRIFVRVRSGR